VIANKRIPLRTLSFPVLDHTRSDKRVLSIFVEGKIAAYVERGSPGLERASSLRF